MSDSVPVFGASTALVPPHSPASSEYARSLSSMPNVGASSVSLPSPDTPHPLGTSTEERAGELALKREHARQKEMQRQMFEAQMAQLERKQLEEQAMLRAQAVSRNSSHRATPVDHTVSPSDRPDVKLPFLPDDPEEGLHGSNVPGLRSLSHSRQASGPGAPCTAKRPGRIDLVYELDRLSVGPTSPSHPPGTPGTRPTPQGFGPGPLDDAGGSPMGRLRAPSSSRSLQNGFGSHPSSPPLRGPGIPNSSSLVDAPALGPLFTESLLLDDELDAESAFVKKYHLHDDDRFAPTNGRRERGTQVPHLSASSAALDLAPLAQYPGANNKVARGRSDWPPHLGRDLQPASPRIVSDSTRLSTPARATSTHSASVGHLSPASGCATPPAGLSDGRFDSPGFPSLFGSPSGFGSFQGMDPAPGAPGRASCTSADAATGPGSGYYDAFRSTARSPSRAPSVGLAAVLGQETNTLPPASTATAAAAAAAAAGLKQTRKGELDMSMRLEDLQGEILGLCKDQHGCRFLQKKLEENSGSNKDMIFAETAPHFAELMTDPFGNYLCQKMLEYSSDEQRNVLVESVAGELVRVSLNMHGTRAVQKMIDFLSSPRQVHSIIVALSMNVVTLIKDLNGNHVIQKCLQRLSAEDNQFIYNAVAAHTVEVATHRHGCCVLQRCIDHASDAQRMQLVSEITYDALTLVQDAFGNYVVQYVLDLNDARCTDALIRQFVGKVCALSVQKFASNVMEKCIRVSSPPTKTVLIDELLDHARLEKLLRDSYANYVVQTALDYAAPAQRIQLVHAIRPILPSIRNTPYGKRIQSKLHRDNYDVIPHAPRSHHQHRQRPLQQVAMPYGMYQPAPYDRAPYLPGLPGVTGVPGVPGVQGVPGVPGVPNMMGMFPGVTGMPGHLPNPVGVPPVGVSPAAHAAPSTLPLGPGTPQQTPVMPFSPAYRFNDMFYPPRYGPNY